MALGAVAIARSSAGAREHSSWQDAAQREGRRYGVEEGYVRASLEGREFNPPANRRTWLDWCLVIGTSAVFLVLAVVARTPHVYIDLGWAAAVGIAMLVLLSTCGIALWRTTRFR
jgi:hypothetical protein